VGSLAATTKEKQAKKQSSSLNKKAKEKTAAIPVGNRK
jgi:hypothetical protein